MSLQDIKHLAESKFARLVAYNCIHSIGGSACFTGFGRLVAGPEEGRIGKDVERIRIGYIK
jgi:hypothetical protein